MSALIKILQVIDGLDRGGIETWMWHIMHQIDRSRYHVDFLVDSDRDYAYSSDLRQLGAKVLPCPGYRKPWVYWKNLKRIYAEHGPYDVLHSQVFYYSGIVLTMAKMLGVPVRIAHIHPSVDPKPSSLTRSFYRTVMMKAIARSCTHVLACSEATLTSFRKQCPLKNQKTTVLHNGVDFDEYHRAIDKNSLRSTLALPPHLPLITYVARFFPHKNHDQVLRVAKILQSEGFQAHFVLAGSHGPEMERLKKATAQHSNISMLTNLTNINELLLCSDLFFFPSLEEGFGVVALEAAAAGLPVVATDLPSIREACHQSQHRLMFPPNDDVVAARNIKELLIDKNLYQELSEKGKKWTLKFSIGSSLAALQEVYDNVALAQLDPSGGIAKRLG